MPTTTCPTEATTEERKVLAELLNLFEQAKGDAPALAEARRMICAETDRFLTSLAAAGVDTDALLDELEA